MGAPQTDTRRPALGYAPNGLAGRSIAPSHGSIAAGPGRPRRGHSHLEREGAEPEEKSTNSVLSSTMKPTRERLSAVRWATAKVNRSRGPPGARWVRPMWTEVWTPPRLPQPP